MQSMKQQLRCEKQNRKKMGNKICYDEQERITRQPNDTNDIGGDNSNSNQGNNNIIIIENIELNIGQTNNQRKITAEERQLCQRELDNMIRSEIKLEKEIDLLKEENESLKKEQIELENKINEKFWT